MTNTEQSDMMLGSLNAKRIGIHLVTIASFLAGLIAIVWLGYGRLTAERVVTQLFLPGGFLAIVLAYSCYLAFRCGKSPWLTVNVLIAFVVYCLVGGGFASDWLLSSLERDYAGIRPLESERFDVLLVLGGGTSVMRDGRIQPNRSGDRVILAARMYNLGKTNKVFVFGGYNTQRGMSEPEAAFTLLTQLGVAAHDVRQVPGENTLGEMQEAQQLLAATEYPRIGLVTSAWHMRRATRLAASCGLTVEPVPADFRSLTTRDMPYSWIPSGGGFDDFLMASKEFVAAWVGR